MLIQEKINALIDYIRILQDFKLVKSEIPVPYNHMGATITDAILQAGVKWKTVVKPRLLKIVKFQEGATTTGFLTLVNRVGLNKLLEWNNHEKPARILNLATFFHEEKIETEADLKAWFQNEADITRLKKLRGIGNKTADYLKILSGISTSAVDRHLIEFLREAGLDVSLNNYAEAQEIINGAADKMSIDKSMLDYSIWKFMSGMGKKEKSCRKVKANKNFKAETNVNSNESVSHNAGVEIKSTLMSDDLKMKGGHSMSTGRVVSQGVYADGKDICEIYILAMSSNELPHVYRRKMPISLRIGNFVFTAGVHETKTGVVWISSVLHRDGTQFRLVDELQKINVKKGDLVLIDKQSKDGYVLTAAK